LEDKTTEKYCLLLGIEKARDRALLAAARTTDLKIALMQMALLIVIALPISF
jgi:hypothetical protein